MNRRESLKAIGLTTLTTSLLFDACQSGTKKEDTVKKEDHPADPDRLAIEVERDKKLQSETFFNAHEMATIVVLADIIIPRDDRSGSASDARVPDFIEFIVKDRPEHQVPLRGGLRWLDLQCLKRYEKPFKDCAVSQQIEMVDEIAYPARATSEMKPGVVFFNRMRDLTASGFFSSKLGMEDLGYMGNKPNVWEGVPSDELERYGLQNVTF